MGIGRAGSTSETTARGGLQRVEDFSLGNGIPFANLHEEFVFGGIPAQPDERHVADRFALSEGKMQRHGHALADGYIVLMSYLFRTSPSSSYAVGAFRDVPLWRKG